MFVTAEADSEGAPVVVDLYKALSPPDEGSLPVDAIRSVGGGRCADVRVGATAAALE